MTLLLYKIFLDPFAQMGAAPDLLVQTLWEGFVGGPVYTAPVVVNGRLLVASWGGVDRGALSAYVP